MRIKYNNKTHATFCHEWEVLPTHAFKKKTRSLALYISPRSQAFLSV